MKKVIVSEWQSPLEGLVVLAAAIILAGGIFVVYSAVEAVIQWVK